MVEHEGSPREYIETRAELASPNTDWDTCWKRARLKGLGSEATSFLWKLLHCLLPSEQRLAKILPNSSDLCKWCPNPIPADLSHYLFQCSSTREVGEWLLNIVRHYDPYVTAPRLLDLSLSLKKPLRYLLCG